MWRCFFISYFDDKYWNGSIFGNSETDNDAEALKALDAIEASRDSGGFDLELPFVDKDLPTSAQTDVESENAEADDSRFDGGEYWLRYFKEADPDDEFFQEEPRENNKPEKKEKPAKQISEKQQAELDTQTDAKPALKPEVETKTPLIPKRKKGAKTLPESEDTLSAARQSKKMRNRGIYTAAAVIGILIVGMVVIAEPWVPAVDDVYTVPQPARYGDTTQIAVGDTCDILIKLEENEQITSVVTPDDDVINVSNGKVTGLGEWDSATVIITTMEAEVPGPYQKEVKIFGIDLTKPYNSVRSYLRNMLGIEKKQPPRTEPRVLNVYEVEYCIQGYTPAKAPFTINLYTDDSYQMTINHPEGTEVIFEYEGQVIEVEKTLPSEDGSVTYIAKSFEAVGTGKIIAKIGFFKDNKFVTTAAIEFDVEVIERPESADDAVFVDGNYNGSVVIEEDDEEETDDN